MSARRAARPSRRARSPWAGLVRRNANPAWREAPSFGRGRSHGAGKGIPPLCGDSLSLRPVLFKQCETSRLLSRPRRHRKHKGKGRDGFSWRDYRDLVVRARIQLGAPIVLIWDNLNVHRATGRRE